MMTCSYKTKGVCSQEIRFTLDEQMKIDDLSFIGGCDGNLKAICQLAKGRSAQEVAQMLRGTTCGLKRTSCPDQLSCALTQVLEQAQSEKKE
ncbi:MAG: TIGR03905 family TSCPD domain-containing protein [Oscillospiraceae bacterium]